MSSHLEPPPSHSETSSSGVIVVPYRPTSSVVAKLLPPLLIMLMGAGFLAYRTRAADWRGLYALLDSSIRPKFAPLPKAAATKQSAQTTSTPQPTAFPPVAKVDPKPEEPKFAPKSVAPATPELSKADPIDDIAREAEKTKDKIAALKKLKERASEQLDQTAQSRERADSQKPKQPRFRREIPADELEQQLHDLMAQGMGLKPGEIDKRMRNQNEQFFHLLEQMQRRQMAFLDEMQRDIFENARPARRIRPPAGFPPAAAMPRPLPWPGFVPNGNGNAQFREFRGPNGMRGFEMRWRDRGRDDMLKPPPPPEPAFPGAKNPTSPPPVD